MSLVVLVFVWCFFLDGYFKFNLCAKIYMYTSSDTVKLNKLLELKHTCTGWVYNMSLKEQQQVALTILEYFQYCMSGGFEPVRWFFVLNLAILKCNAHSVLRGQVQVASRGCTLSGSADYQGRC